MYNEQRFDPEKENKMGCNTIYYTVCHVTDIKAYDIHTEALAAKSEGCQPNHFGLGLGLGYGLGRM